MLIVNLIRQDFLKNVRSSGFYKNLVANIFYGLMGLYFLAIFLFIGFNLHKILLESGSHYNPLLQICGALFYTMLTGLSFRFMMQSLTTFNLPPYQVLNIKRSTLVHFIILKPLFNPTNYLTLLIMLPFAFKYVAVYYGAFEAFSFVWVYINIIWFNSLFASFLKRKFGPSFRNTLILIVVFGAIVGLEFFKIFSLFNVSLAVFSFLVLNPVGWIVSLATSVLAFTLNKWFFSQNYYAETFNKFASKSKAIITDFAFLNRFGIEGELMSMELKLILRHKRTKSILYMTGFFLLYGLIFYPQKIYQEQNGTLFFVAIFVTGLAMLMFGQWVISWDSSHFDGLMTKNVTAKSYMQANYKLLAAFAIASFVLTTPYFLFGWRIMFMHITAFLFNIGVNIFVLLFFSTYNTKRIDLSKGSAMNYQGVTMKNFLVQIPMLLVPIFLVWLLSTFFSITVALSVLSVLGITGIVFTRPLINACVKQFQDRKYILAEGFREGE
jgi:hypothetical protein